MVFGPKMGQNFYCSAISAIGGLILEELLKFQHLVHRVLKRTSEVNKVNPVMRSTITVTITITQTTIITITAILLCFCNSLILRQPPSAS